MISIFDIFKIGLGPSSSHTVGPMKAAAAFSDSLQQNGLLESVQRIVAETYGSLALTGLGHGTFDAILLGLEGSLPHNVPLADMPARLQRIRERHELHLRGRTLAFCPDTDLLIHGDETLPLHPNGLRFSAYDANGECLISQVYYSVGGGFVVTEEGFGQEQTVETAVPYPFKSAAELLARCREEQLNICEVVLANEMALSGSSEAEVRARVAAVADAMEGCIKRGLGSDGNLPGGLNVRRRAPQLAAKLKVLRETEIVNTQLWPMVYAMAVNEENAAGGRVVTAPTNGAAGIIPAVLHYYRKFNPHASQERVENFLLTAGAIGILYKTNASISGADVGCQGEVGVACSMAAGAYAEAIGGTPKQVENAAEMAMEHHLGLTCDPVGGLVQIPCIERNGIAAEKALKLGALALLEDGTGKKVSLDEVIQTMLQTGRDMKSTYKETSLAGLAVTLQQKPVPVSVRVVEC
ncbi:serine dehydratase [Neisseria arctica]|uniref:L-serine dehydratase n=1 Tax=Neisseria arctica TaxID=1470200 RepID=A0A0J0YS04_9NEIS|nr:L-serine ammonia-lyase [Neisseria arctica]KLT72877.1 serine dehydratase [Neisseria arctica]UOO86589.1 L-serine ammonia-lyase [Neisseria arctica]